MKVQVLENLKTWEIVSYAGKDFDSIKKASPWDLACWVCSRNYSLWEVVDITDI